MVRAANRRTLTAALAAALALLVECLTLAPVATEASHDGGRPNVLIILTDDQRANGTVTSDMIGQAMPNTNARFRTEGKEFTEGYASQPICCPARASILSGRYANKHGVLTIGRRDSDAPAVNRLGATNFDQTQSLQRYLQKEGYHTGVFGKFLNGWRNGATETAVRNHPLFWDRYSIFEVGQFGAGPLVEDGVWVRQRPPEEFHTHYLADKAVDFVRDARALEKPWFALVAPLSPHSPYDYESKYQAESFGEFQLTPANCEGQPVSSDCPNPDPIEDKPPWTGEGTTQSFSGVFTDENSIRRRQLRALRSVDDMVGEIFAEFGDEESDRTLAFFLSDNGFSWLEHKHFSKGDPYTDSIKIPFLARWPEHLSGQDSRPVANVDIAPTIFDAIDGSPDGNADLPFPMDGRSLFTPRGQREILLERYTDAYEPSRRTGGRRWASLRGEDAERRHYQYIEHLDDTIYCGSGADGLEGVTFNEYYDLENDRYQLQNTLPGNDLSSPSPEVLALSARLKEAGRPCQGPLPRPIRSSGFDASASPYGFDATSGSVTREPSDRGNVGRAHHEGGSGTAPEASFDVSVPNDWEVIYSAWFKLPAGFFAQQQSDVVLMQWDNARNVHPEQWEERGGIMIRQSDRTLRLFRQLGSGSRTVIDQPANFTTNPVAVPLEDRWFYVWVRQRLSNNDPASVDYDVPTNYVWTNATLLGPQWLMFGHEQQNRSMNTVLPADRLRFGLVGYAGSNSLDVLFDDPTVHVNGPSAEGVE